MVGKTKQIPVFILNLKEAQKRDAYKTNDPKNGIGKHPKNGTLKRSQKRDTEPSVSFNHQLEPSIKETEDIFSFWIEIFNKNKSKTKFTDQRKTKIKSRLKNYSPSEIKTAITNCSKSLWHVENGYTDLTLICRDDSKLENFRDMKYSNNQEPTKGGRFEL